jgi:hypothetical protein
MAADAKYSFLLVSRKERESIEGIALGLRNCKSINKISPPTSSDKPNTSTRSVRGKVSKGGVCSRYWKGCFMAQK